MDEPEDPLAAIAHRNQRGLLSLGAVAGVCCLAALVLFVIEGDTRAIFYAGGGLAWAVGMIGLGLRRR